MLCRAWLCPKPPTAEITIKDKISIKSILKTVLVYRTNFLIYSYFEIPGKTIQHSDLAFDKNHDLLSVRVFILQAKNLLKYYLEMGIQRGNTKQGFLCVRGGTDSSRLE